MVVWTSWKGNNESSGSKASCSLLPEQTVLFLQKKTEVEPISSSQKNHGIWSIMATFSGDVQYSQVMGQ